MPKFYLAPPDAWIIAPSVPHSRRLRLLGRDSFGRIIDKICSEARVTRISRENGNEAKRGLHRWIVVLRVMPRTIDLWHNSRAGYRAQYYMQRGTGESANRYAARRLWSVAREQIVKDVHRKRFWSLACKSICHAQTRVWIGQGPWLRRAKRTDGVLRVSRWQGHAQAGSKKVRKLVRWGALMPTNEERLILKGQWLMKDGEPTNKAPKVTRAKQINEYGYT